MWPLELIWKSRKQDTHQHLSSWPQNDSFMQELCGTGSSARIQCALMASDVLAWDPPLSLANALCHSHFPTPVTRRNLETRCSQSTAHAPLVGCWLLQNDKRRLPAQPSTSFEAHGKLVWSQELLPHCWLTARVQKREPPTSRDSLRKGTKHM